MSSEISIEIFSAQTGTQNKTRFRGNTLTFIFPTSFESNLRIPLTGKFQIYVTVIKCTIFLSKTGSKV